MQIVSVSYRRQFAWNVKAYFLVKLEKKRQHRVLNYRIYHMYSDRQAWANSIDPDETPQNAASYLGLHCSPLIQQFLDTTSGNELYWFNF